MKLLVAALAALAGSVASAAGASLHNGDSEVRTISVSEQGRLTELEVLPGEALEFCQSGCFVTYPGGDIEALVGTEKIEILDGKHRYRAD